MSVRFRKNAAFRLITLLWMPVFLTCAVASKAVAQAPELAARDDPAKQVHWAMGAFFGTGWYQVDDNRSVFVFRIPPRQTLRESSFDENGKRKRRYLYGRTKGKVLEKLDGLRLGGVQVFKPRREPS